MKTVILSAAFFFYLSTFLSAQITNTWKGGAPGHETDWHFYKNWSLGKAPDEFSNVFIPDVSSRSLAAPVLEKGSVEINSLFLESAASLTIGREAVLVVLTEAQGLEHANVSVKGNLQLPGIEAEKKTVAAAMRR
jgi:hypothetical protein